MERFRASVAKTAKMEFAELRTSVMAGEKSKLGWARQQGEINKGLGINSGKMSADLSASIRQAGQATQAYDEMYHGLNRINTAQLAVAGSASKMVSGWKVVAGIVMTFKTAEASLNAMSFAIDAASSGNPGRRFKTGIRDKMLDMPLIGGLGRALGGLSDTVSGMDMVKKFQENERERGEIAARVLERREAEKTARGEYMRGAARVADDANFERGLRGLTPLGQEVAKIQHETKKTLEDMNVEFEKLSKIIPVTKAMREAFGAAKGAVALAGNTKVAEALDKDKREREEKRAQEDAEMRRQIRQQEDMWDDEVKREREKKIDAIREVMQENKSIASSQHLGLMTATSSPRVAVNGREQRREAAERRQEITQDVMKRALEKIQENTEFLRNANVALN